MPMGTKGGILNAVVIAGLIFCYLGGYLPGTIVGAAAVVVVFANIFVYRQRRKTSNQ